MDEKLPPRNILDTTPSDEMEGRSGKSNIPWGESIGENFNTSENFIILMVALYVRYFCCDSFGLLFFYLILMTRNITQIL